MDKDRWKQISRIFDIALDLPDDRRTTYIKQLCEGDPGLERQVHDLLDSLEESDRMLDDYLEKNAELLSDLNRHLEHGYEEPSYEGRTVGEWQLQQKLGTGGMGAVYKAYRMNDGVQQWSAVKILHEALNTSEYIGRFRLEQQILAGLYHPHIAGLIDSGITEDGMPYLAMEYVDGTPIHRYCREYKLPVRKRLFLYKSVCSAVIHAHRNLVVHRDLKPENILVDREGHVTVLDFGIAKLLDPDRYGLAPVETRADTRLMSMEYAAPEQLSGEPITTSTDIFTLGILLFELLTGRTPFETDDMSYRQIRDRILTDPPPRPSRSLSGETGATAEDLKQVNGDLDAICLKAMRKDPRERYESVGELMRDIDAYLEEMPVQARSGSTRYRIGKFVKRHRTGLAAVFLFLLSIGSLVAYYTVQLARERNTARLEAETARQVSSFLVSLFEASRPGQALGDTVTAQTLLERGLERAEALDSQPVVQARMFDEIGRAYRALGHYRQAMLPVGKALELRKRIYGEHHPEVAAALNQQGLLLKEQGEYAAAESLYHRALAIQGETLDSDDPGVAETLNNLGVLHRITGEYEEAEAYLRGALELRRSINENDTPETAKTLQNLGTVLMMRGNFEQAETVLREALETVRELQGDRHPMTATILLNLGHVIKEQKRYEEAERLYRRALEIKRNLYGNDNPDVAQTLNNLGVLLVKKGELDSAETLLREATDIRRRHYGENHAEYVASLHNLAFFLQKKGDYRTADSLYGITLEKWRTLLGPRHPNVAVTLNNLAEVQKAQHKNVAAEQNYRRAFTLRRIVLGPDHPAVKRSLQRLVEFYDDWDKPALAAAYRDTLSQVEQ